MAELESIKDILERINAVSKVQYSVLPHKDGYVVIQRGNFGSCCDGKVLMFSALMEALRLLLIVKTSRGN